MRMTFGCHTNSNGKSRFSMPTVRPAMIYGSPQLWHGWTENPQDIQAGLFARYRCPAQHGLVSRATIAYSLFLAKKSDHAGAIRRPVAASNSRTGSVDLRIAFGAYTRIRFFCQRSVSKPLYSYRMNVGTDIGSTGIPSVPFAGQQENTIPGIRDC